MSTITKEQEQAIADTLARMPHLAVGVGTEDEACSLAAINLALTGELTDDIPECMSPVVGRWIIEVQDRMPASIRDSAEWGALLPLAAGTGRKHEQERLAVVRDWTWDALSLVQPFADSRGFGDSWRTMLVERTGWAAANAADDLAARATYATNLAYRAAANAAAYAAAARAAANAANYAAAAANAANAADYAAAYAANAADNAWSHLDPVGTLRALINVSTETEGVAA